MEREKGKCQKCGKENTPLNEVDKDDFDVLKWNGKDFVKPEGVVVYRKICEGCCRGSR